jgi:hypothetical protein
MAKLTIQPSTEANKHIKKIDSKAEYEYKEQ